MNRLRLLLVLIAGISGTVSLQAQDAEEPAADPPGRRGAADADRPQGPGGPGPGGFMRMFPMFAVLDANEDGEISARELKKAMTRLQTLDANQDGNLTEDELRPQFPGGPGGFGGQGLGPDGPGGQGGPGQRGFGGPDGQGGPNAPGGRGGQGAPGQRGFGGPSGGGFAPATPESLVERWLAFDADKDGKLNQEELTAMAQQLVRPAFPGQPGQEQPKQRNSKQRRGRLQQATE